MIAQLETSNEELHSVNEEYQSTTEEMQSSNEELGTLNDELTIRTQELAVVNSELETLLELAVDGIVVLNQNLRVIRYSASCRQLFCLMPASIGKPLIAVGGTFNLAFLSSEVQHALHIGEAVERDIVLGERNFLVRLIPMKSKDDDVPGVVVTFTDETQRLNAAAEAQRLAAVLKDSSDAISLMDFDGKYLAWNFGATRLYGYTETEALELNLLDLTPHEKRDQALQFIYDLKSGKLIESADTQRLTKDGRILDVWMTVTILKNDANSPVGIATTERDLTGRQRDAAEQRAAKLAHVHRLNTLGEMASGLAHELNQPLTAITQLGDAPPHIAWQWCRPGQRTCRYRQLNGDTVAQGRRNHTAHDPTYPRW
jgi:two-component system CheB/CheR fusion protein